MSPSLPCGPCARARTVRAGGLALVWGLLLLAGCRPESRSTVVPIHKTFQPAPLHDVPIGQPAEGKPWITHVSAVDLDRDGLLDVVACDARTDSVTWVRQVSRGVFTEQLLAGGVRGPVRTEAVDFDGDGDLDLLVASMGVVFPNNDSIGAVVLLRNDGPAGFTPVVLAEKVARVTDVRAADLNADGRLDLAVAHFGYDQGSVHWYENLGDGRFAPHALLALAGAVNVTVADFDRDGDPDLAALVSQQWEEVMLFRNDGGGRFTPIPLFGSTNEDYGSSGMSAADLNRDGLIDLIFTNGDGFDYAEPGSRPWHGVQWLENVGGGQFRYHFIGNWPGVYSPCVVDYDGDGALDVVVVSGSQDWERAPKASLVLFRNDGSQHFQAHPMAARPTHLISVAGGDFAGDGRVTLVTGGFHAYPPYDHMSRLSLWRTGVVP